MRLRPRGLRARSVIAFALLALVLSVTFSVVTYQLARWYLSNQRETLATRQAMINALVVNGLVGAGNPDPADVLDSLRAASNARAVVRINGGWYATVVEVSEGALPASLVERVEAEGAARQWVQRSQVTYVVVGVALPTGDAVYVEFVPVVELRRTLETLGAVLAVGATVTTVAGAVAGLLASRRVMRPLADVAAAARAMSDGDLTRRLDVGHDPDLEPVADSFNEMAASLEERIGRELRFTADVSHELRTPLTAMASAVSLARRGDLAGRAKFAVEVLDEQVEHLRRLTLELLEISRIDAGVSELAVDDVPVVDATRRVMSAHQIAPTRLHCRVPAELLWPLDATRYERVLSNLFENAERYAGGVEAVTLAIESGALVITVDDDGPGVPPEERRAIFGRFHRGSMEQPADRPKGTGLGLSLVEEHVRMHGGSVYVTDGPSGGARFVVTLPGRS